MDGRILCTIQYNININRVYMCLLVNEFVKTTSFGVKLRVVIIRIALFYFIFSTATKLVSWQASTPSQDVNISTAVPIEPMAIFKASVARSSSNPIDTNSANATLSTTVEDCRV